MAQQDRRTSSLERDMTEQRNGFYTVNWGVSKNRVDIGEISRDMTLQRNWTSSLAEDFVKVTQDIAAQDEAIDRHFGRLEHNLTTQTIAIDRVDEEVAEQERKT